MKKFTFKGVLDNFRTSVVQQSRPDQEIQETLRPENFQVKRGENDVLFTCSVCDSLMTHEEIHTHHCTQGCEVLEVDEKNYFYPATEDDTIEDDLKDTSSAANDWSECVSSSQNIRKKLIDADVKRLISAVHKRELLWNLALPQNHKSRVLIKRHWEDVCRELDHKLTPEEARIKFKGLRDTHRRLIQAEHYKSESGKSEKSKWKFYDAMNFLRDTCPIRNTPNKSTSGNDHIYSKNLDVSIKTDIPSSSQIDTSKRTKIHRFDEDEEENSTTERIADALIRAPPKMDSVDLILGAAGFEIRKIKNDKTRMALLMDVMKLVNERVQAYESN